MAELPAARQGVLRLGRREFLPGQPLIMGIVNRTPDSFFRPAVTWDESAAMDRVHQVIAEGADIVDIGGVPAAPGADVDAAEEIRRTAGFIAGVRAAIPRWSSAPTPGGMRPAGPPARPALT
jgi:dihydropteroate synthase